MGPPFEADRRSPGTAGECTTSLLTSKDFGVGDLFEHSQDISSQQPRRKRVGSRDGQPLNQIVFDPCYPR